MVHHEQKERALSFRDHLYRQLQSNQSFEFIVRTYEETRQDLIRESRRHRITNPKVFKEIGKLNYILQSEYPLIVTIRGGSEDDLDRAVKFVLIKANEKDVSVVNLESYNNRIRESNSRYIILTVK